MLAIGITGGIACGKSTILGQIKSLGHDVFSADESFREIFNTDVVQGWLASQIELRYGVEKRIEYEESGKTLLRYLVLSDPAFKKDYETLVHPMVRSAMLESGAQIAEVPLLFESGAENCFFSVWTVACSPESQVKRLMNRLGCNRDYALAWINNQMPLKDKISRANRVIYTDVPEEQVFEIVKQALMEDLGEP